MKRDEFLDQVKEIVCVSRQDQHGNPESTFARIALMWTTYVYVKFGVEVQIREVDVAMMMNLFKVARACGNTENMENYLDMAGYVANAAEIVSGCCVESE